MTATIAWTARRSTRCSRRAPTGSSWRRPVPATRRRSSSPPRERAMAAGLPVALTTRSPCGAASADYAFPGGGATWVRAGALLTGHLGGPKARVALALGIGAGLDRAALGVTPRRPGPRRRGTLGPCHSKPSSPAGSRRSRGSRGFGWVEAVGITRGRVAFAGSAVELETRADPFTVRFELDPDEVAIPGLTDSHLHLAEGGIAKDNVDVSLSPSLQAALAEIRAFGSAHPDGSEWIEGHGWDPDRFGRWPTADDLESVVPGRHVALWAHDHHSLWASKRIARGCRDRPRHRGSRRRPDPARRCRRADRRPPRDGRPPRREHRPRSRRAERYERGIAAARGGACPARRRRDPRSGRALAAGGARLGDRRVPLARRARRAADPDPRLHPRGADRVGRRGRPAQRRPALGRRRPGPLRLAEALRRRDAGVADGRAARTDRAGGGEAAPRGNGAGRLPHAAGTADRARRRSPAATASRRSSTRSATGASGRHSTRSSRPPGPCR